MSDVSGGRAKSCRAERHLVAAILRKTTYKVCMIQFRNDGTFFVHFPYGPDAPGHVAKADARPWATEVDFGGDKRITTHKVKYTHHPDGHCHFSQDGRIKTEVRNESASLKDDPGHVFSLDVQGLDRFAETQESDYKKYNVLAFVISEGTELECLHLTGFWRTLPPNQNEDLLVNPLQVKEDAGVATYMGAAAPKGFSFDDHVMLLALRAIPKLNDQPVLLNFVGGFGPDIGDWSKTSTLLVLGYPDLDTAGFPTVDYTPPTSEANHDAG